MRFSEALEKCIGGAKITRRDWNGKNMFVYYVPGRVIPVALWKECTCELQPSEIERDYVETKGHFDMFNADGDRIIGWVATQTDLTSDQWEVLE